MDALAKQPSPLASSDRRPAFTLAAVGQPVSGPLRMVCGVYVPFGVWHQSEHATGFVTDAGDVAIRSIGIVWPGNHAVGPVRIAIFDGQLIILL